MEIIFRICFAIGNLLNNIKSPLRRSGISNWYYTILFILISFWHIALMVCISSESLNIFSSNAFTQPDLKNANRLSLDLL